MIEWSNESGNGQQLHQIGLQANPSPTYPQQGVIGPEHRLKRFCRCMSRGAPKKSKESRLERPKNLLDAVRMPGWEKQLYRRQPFNDTYSGGDECFLNELRKNVSVVKYSWCSAVLGAFHLTTHLNVVLLYFVLFEAIYNENMHFDTLLWSYVGITVSCYLFYNSVLRPKDEMRKKWEELRDFLTLFVFGYALTPIIRTLTTTISTDTIYALAIIFALVSCIFHDYGIRAPIVSTPVSVSCGLCSSVLLISRLKDSSSAFLLLAISFSQHSLSPIFQNALMNKYSRMQALLGLILSGLSCVTLWEMNAVLSIIWAIVVIFVVVICPLLLIRLQHRKSTIHGPWDEAVPARSASDLLK
ncbi:unnamed protein product, partial [Mesorhabditis belari]|uniref:Phosphatidylinositol N-acetylglucosaminyltransferase subunit C n=1 Tax=Mesorhabditis belari TaxID=2138241 RepID=A0AAF3J9F0_9BILA